MSSRSIKDTVKALQHLFSLPKVPASLPSEARRMLQAFVIEHEDSGHASEQDAADANTHIHNLWERFVNGNPSKLGAFTGVLRELQPAIVSRKDIFSWWQLVLRPVITSTSQKKAVYEDAHHFLVKTIVYEDDDSDAAIRAAISERLTKDLFSLYIARSRIVDAVERDHDVADNFQVAQRAESILVAFGKKHPKDLCMGIDELIQSPATRLQALTLLGGFLKHQIPHLYTISNTPLVSSLLKCLMNDTSVTVVSVAISTLIMILPHIPGSLTPHLPRLFLIYSRLLCWEKFSPLSTDAQKQLVTDDRLAADGDMRDVGIDSGWSKAVPSSDDIEATTPEARMYFTILYGLYPLNFMTYIRRPRKYLKTVNFPGADDFDLDQSVIRARSDQFREMHRLHPNFYHLTMSEELEDPKWIKTDPSDVVADCHALVIRTAISNNPGNPPSRRLPDLPPSTPTGNGMSFASGRTSPAHSLASHKSSQNRRVAKDASDTTSMHGTDSSHNLPAMALSTDERSVLPAPDDAPSLDDFPLPLHTLPKPRDGAENNTQYLQQRITLLTNELNFEKWHKAQYSQHISQLARKSVKDATAEAETLNLINANRALKQQIEQIRNARESSLKDSALTRKQATNLENHMMERFRNMKKDQEGWMTDSAELRRLRDEIAQYRDLLVACEARELSKTHELDSLRKDLDQYQSTKDQLREANKRIREYEYRDFEFDRNRRELEILQREKDTLQMKFQRHEQEADRSQRAYKDRITELEARTLSPDSYPRSPAHATADSRMLMHQMEAEANIKLAQLKKAYNRLLERHTDLELECQALRARLARYQGTPPDTARSPQRELSEGGFDFVGIGNDGLGSVMRGGDSAYDSYGEYNAMDPLSKTTSASDLTARRYGPSVTPTANPQDSMISRAPTVSSRASTQLVMYNQTAPLDDNASIRSPLSEGSGDTAKEKKATSKIQPSSEIRVYGRGGAQNIKLKNKDKKEKSDADKPKSGFRGFRNIM